MTTYDFKNKRGSAFIRITVQFVRLRNEINDCCLGNEGIKTKKWRYTEPNAFKALDLP